MEGRVLAGGAVPLFGRGETAPTIATAAARVRISTRESIEIVDLTTRLEAFVRTVGLVTGWVNVQSRHTTTGILVNEHETLLLEDLTALLERLAPRNETYAHDDLHRRTNVPPDERANGHSHAKAALLRTSETLNVVGGSLRLGRWQRVLLVELDGPRSREVSLVALGSGGTA